MEKAICETKNKNLNVINFLEDEGIFKLNDEEETAKYLEVLYWLVGRMIMRNKISNFRVRGRVLLGKKSIDEYMEQQEKIAFDKLYANNK